MTHQTVDTSILKLLQPNNKFTQLIEPNAETTHASVNFDMHIGHNSGIRSCLIKQFDHVEPRDNRSQSLLNAELGLSRPEPGETEQRLNNPCGAQFNSLFG